MNKDQEQKVLGVKVYLEGLNKNVSKSHSQRMMDLQDQITGFVNEIKKEQQNCQKSLTRFDQFIRDNNSQIKKTFANNDSKINKITNKIKNLESLLSKLQTVPNFDKQPRVSTISQKIESPKSAISPNIQPESVASEEEYFDTFGQSFQSGTNFTAN